MKLKEVLDKTIQFFKDKGIETARLDAELLLSTALKIKRIDLYLKFDQPLAEPELNICRDFVKRRSAGEPVAYIVGHKAFYDYDFYVNKNVLIPRPETELIVEAVINWVKKNPRQGYEVIDLGTGSGCLGLSIHKKINLAETTLVDISAEALSVAKKNAENLQADDRAIHFICSAVDENVFANKKFDIIVANPPYIDPADTEVQDSVRKFEPHLALFAEGGGLSLLKEWSRLAAPYLSRPGILIFEMGYQQGAAMKDHFHSLGIFDEVVIIKDLAGLDRHIVGVNNG